MEVLAIGSFVEDPQNYSDLKDFWKHTFTDLTGLPATAYVNNQYGNGKEILDGNPIFTSVLDGSRGIRIIQTEFDDGQPALSSWINETTIADSRFEELVIALQLSFDTFTDTSQLIRLYADETLTPAILESINEKYSA